MSSSSKWNEILFTLNSNSNDEIDSQFCMWNGISVIVGVACEKMAWGGKILMQVKAKVFQKMVFWFVYSWWNGPLISCTHYHVDLRLMSPMWWGLISLSNLRTIKCHFKSKHCCFCCNPISMDIITAQFCTYLGGDAVSHEKLVLMRCEFLWNIISLRFNFGVKNSKWVFPFPGHKELFVW